MSRNVWTKEETIIAFNIYCKVPFKKSNARHPLIVKYAAIIGRTPAALNMKIGNFGRLDPELKKQGISGLVNGSKMEEIVWDEFHGNWSDLSYESEVLISKFQNKSIHEREELDLLNIPEGVDKERLVKTRVNQSFFRSTVLSSYNNRCCITGLSIPSLLVAGHIIPWSMNQKERLNPRNGLCLNALHDKAFDKGLITILPSKKIVLSQQLTDENDNPSFVDFFLKFENRKISLPEKFFPADEFLAYHNKNVFFIMIHQ